MKTTETQPTKIEAVLKGLFDLNDLVGNEGSLSNLDVMFIAFMGSQECEEMGQRERSDITFYFLKLKEVIAKTKNLYEKDIEDFKNQN